MKKILIVDDETDILFIIKSYLKGNKFDARVASTCKEGMEILQLEIPDLILLDVNLGGADGRLMCRQINSQAQYQHIPIILISANRQVLLSYAEYGAVTYLEKPFELSGLLKTVQSYLPA